jgi:osmotically-inducible protein OsmY
MATLYVVLSLLLLVMPAAGADNVSDDQLFDNVRIRLANDREVGGERIDVKVENGVVELTGKVTTEKQKERAAKIAKKVKGVKSVVNRIQVSPL